MYKYNIFVTFYSIERCVHSLKESEIHMVKGLRAGRESTYAQLFNEYYRPLTVFANKYVSDMESARELVQAFFVSIYENRKALLITTSLKSYLYQSVRNVA